MERARRGGSRTPLKIEIGPRKRMISMSRVEHPGKFSIILLKGGVLKQVRGHRWIEHDEAVWEDNEELLGHLKLVKQPKWQVHSLT